MNGEASSFVASEDQVFVGKLKDSFQIAKGRKSSLQQGKKKSDFKIYSNIACQNSCKQN